jgi:hypothetical protein
VYWPVFDSSDIWVPFIVLTNIVNKMEPIGGDTIFNAFIFPDGEAVNGVEIKSNTTLSGFE